MNRTTIVDPTAKEKLVERIRLSFQSHGAALDEIRLERIQSLPRKYLNRLMNELREIEASDRDVELAVADEICQIHLNEVALAKLLENGVCHSSEGYRIVETSVAG